MSQRLKISFLEIIDASMPGWFEQGVITSSYQEFLLKSQTYNQENKFRTLKEMVDNNVKAESLHYKCGFPVIPYVDRLKNEIPGLNDNTGNAVRFESYLFQIIHSDIIDPLTHKVSITYTTGSLSLINNFGHFLLLASEKADSEFLLEIIPGMNIRPAE